eukprot:2444562-Rhodomonas_salina.3
MVRRFSAGHRAARAAHRSQVTSMWISACIALARQGAAAQRPVEVGTFFPRTRLVESYAM